MNRGFWDKLNKPIMALAPMANVTDAAFRQMIAKYGKPDVFWTEFVSADGLMSKGKGKLLVDLWFNENEHPIVAQVFGSNPENFYKAAKIIKKLGFDGIDINMGCPDRAVVKQGAGGALIKNPKLAQEIILATKEGAGRLPVSVKTRTGFGKDALEEWLPHLFEVKLAAIVIHARTVKEQSLVPARWDQVALAVKLARALSKNSRPLILGNGDVQTLTEADEKCMRTGADGVMIGRGIFGNPWLFNRNNPIEKVPISKRLQAMLEHTRLFEKKFKGVKNFEVMKKHYKVYVNGFNGAKELRIKLMATKNAKEVEALVKEFVT
jgi:nifR3 family TIM-barrel protein